MGKAQSRLQASVGPPGLSTIGWFTDDSGSLQYLYRARDTCQDKNFHDLTGTGTRRRDRDGTGADVPVATSSSFFSITVVPVLVLLYFVRAFSYQCSTLRVLTIHKKLRYFRL